MGNNKDVSLELVKKCKEHAKIIMQWRNDAQTLKASFHQSPKVWESFYFEFLNSYFSIPDLPPFFILHEGNRVGFIQLKLSEDYEHLKRRCCDVSVNIAPQYRGQGLSATAIRLSCDFAKKAGFDVAFADIRPDNSVSKRVFEKAGFIHSGKETRFISDLNHRILVDRFTLEFNKHDQHEAFIIAEAGSNWRMGSRKRDMVMARTLIDKAKEAGANAVKFQVFKAGSVYAKNAGSAQYLKNKGEQSSIDDIFKDLELPDDFLPELYEYCENQKIEFMASTFSKEDFAIIDPYVKRHKIASYEITHLRLLEQAALSKKPLILSTGAASIQEIDWAVEYFKNKGGEELTLLQCTARYPAEATTLNLKAIPFLKKHFGVTVGLSDHSEDPVLAPVAAIALGAKVIEKHFTLNKNLPGPDHSFAVTAEGLKLMVKSIREMEQMLGEEEKVIADEEAELRSFACRALQANKDICKGDILKEGDNVEILRPGINSKGVHPRFLFDLEGKKATKDIKCGTGLQEGDW
ncbi:MAG: GNAT family N-acetyltransferase [Chlamydiales bacterium]|nr:GNAT family N-acetyltransferase [Chlamydiales bacterium]NCF70557.1 GNAT family N-acetyltransferase [Chlamydiales bacterium]